MTFSIHLLLVEDMVKLAVFSSFSYPLSQNCRQLPSLLSFQLSIHSLTPVCQASVELLGGTSRGWGEIYSKRIMLFININQSTSEHHPSL